MSVLTEIRVTRRGSKQRLVLLDDEPWRAVPADVVREARLQVGDDVMVDDLNERLGVIERRMARDRAVRLLTYKDRSSAELVSRLEEDGYDALVASDTVTRMRDLGFVDDERFARNLARSLTQGKALGRTRAMRDMLARGVDPEAVAAALDEALPGDEEEHAALAVARVFARRAGATRERVAARLMRKGYGPRIALSAARQACDDGTEAGDGDLWEMTDAPDAPDHRSDF